MSHLNDIRIPRHYEICSSHQDNIEIYVMVDGTGTAYSAADYV